MARDLLKLLPQRLKQERKRAGLTLEELAAQANISPTFAAHLEAGRKNPSLETLIDLARVLGVDPSHFLKGVPRPSENEVFARQFLAIIRNKSTREKQALLQVVRAAASI